jgi:hypothetical protein
MDGRKQLVRSSHMLVAESASVGQPARENVAEARAV